MACDETPNCRYWCVYRVLVLVLRAGECQQGGGAGHMCCWRVWWQRGVNQAGR